MQVNTVYVFKPPFYTPNYKEFYSSHELKDFLQNFNFMRVHESKEFNTGLPEFQLGYRIGVIINGFYYKSDVKWGPRFIAGKRVREEKDGKIFASVPMDKISDTKIIKREYQEVRFSKNMADAIINMDSLNQIWPKHQKFNSELLKFFRRAMKEQNKMKKVY